MVLGMAAAGCATDSSYDAEWGSDEIATGKADGLLDSAQVLHLGETGTGYVADRQMDLYAIDLKAGDQITAVMSVTSGDLNPQFTLFFGADRHVSSATFSHTTTSLTKTYAVTQTGRYYVAVRAYQNEGAGNYAFVPTCNGGPCAMPGTVGALTLDEQAQCITDARSCSFAALPQYSGNVDGARAREIFDGCLAAAQSASGATCAPACDDADGTALCNAIVADLPFYADRSGECTTMLGECMDTCFEYASDAEDPTDLKTTREGACWEFGFSSSCDSYARGLAECGGSEYADESAQCEALCYATSGAWGDYECSEACN